MSMAGRTTSLRARAPAASEWPKQWVGSMCAFQFSFTTFVDSTVSIGSLNPCVAFYIQ